MRQITKQCLNINYRISNQAKWPAQIQDCQEAIRWLRANGSNYGINTDKIAVWGSSAGGHLASMLGVLSNLKASEIAPSEKGQKTIRTGSGSYKLLRSQFIPTNG